MKLSHFFNGEGVVLTRQGKRAVVAQLRPVAVLNMVDSNVGDQKIIAVPTRNPRYDQIHTIDQVFPHNLREIEHFFAIYKELEGKRTEMRGWRGPRS